MHQTCLYSYKYPIQMPKCSLSLHPRTSFQMGALRWVTQSRAASRHIACGLPTSTTVQVGRYLLVCTFRGHFLYSYSYLYLARHAPSRGHGARLPGWLAGTQPNATQRTHHGAMQGLTGASIRVWPVLRRAAKGDWGRSPGPLVLRFGAGIAFHSHP